MTRLTIRLATIVCAFAAAGCSVGSDGARGFGQEVGIVATSPDEFLIIASKPIEMPPSFDLPRPAPGQRSRVERDATEDAHSALFNRPEPPRLGEASRGERVLLDGADADGDNAIIREALAEDDPGPEERQFGLRTFGGFQIPANIDEPEGVLDSVEEIEALRERGLLTPAAPPDIAPEEGSGSFVFRGGS